MSIDDVDGCVPVSCLACVWECVGLFVNACLLITHQSSICLSVCLDIIALLFFVWFGLKYHKVYYRINVNPKNVFRMLELFNNKWRTHTHTHTHTHTCSMCVSMASTQRLADVSTFSSAPTGEGGSFTNIQTTHWEGLAETLPMLTQQTFQTTHTQHTHNTHTVHHHIVFRIVLGAFM